MNISEEYFREILAQLGENPDREGLLDTPKRYIRHLSDFLHKPEFNFTMFDAEGMDEMILENGIGFWSLCEHHTLPFFGTADIAYLPNGKIAGLSKIPWTVKYFASGFQNQERLTTQISDFLMDKLKPKGVAVVLRARHSCMEMRGVKAFGVTTRTQKLVGAFKDDARTRAEFFASIA